MLWFVFGVDLTAKPSENLRMASDEPRERKRRRLDRERVLRTLTFWLRPEFLLRVVNRFQKVAGFDRSIALASGALTAVIPLTIIRAPCPRNSGAKTQPITSSTVTT